MQRKIVTGIMLTLLFTGMPITIIGASSELPSVYVDPEHNEFSTTTTSIGDEFDVTIEAADWPDPGLFAFEFKFYYDPSMLEPVPDGTGIDPGFWITTFIVASGFNHSVDPPQPYVDGEGNPFLWFTATLLEPDYRVGSGILAKARFKIISEPSEGEELSSDLDMRDVYMADPSFHAYPEDYYEVIDGTYRLFSPIPPVEDPEAFIDYVNEIIQDLPDETFVVPGEDVTDVKYDFSNLLSDVRENINEGNYEAAIEKLSLIKEKIYETMAETAEREELISRIDDLVAYLETLL